MIFISNYFIVFYSFVGTNDNNKSFVNFEAFMPYRISNGYIIPQASYLPKLLEIAGSVCADHIMECHCQFQVHNSMIITNICVTCYSKGFVTLRYICTKRGWPWKY